MAMGLFVGLAWCTLNYVIGLSQELVDTAGCFTKRRKSQHKSVTYTKQATGKELISKTGFNKQDRPGYCVSPGASSFGVFLLS